jgi:hypothetical protein
MACARFGSRRMATAAMASSASSSTLLRSARSTPTTAVGSQQLPRGDNNNHNSNAACLVRFRGFGTVREVATADDALRFSGYSAIDFTIPEDAPVYDAVQKFAAFNIGCLVTVDSAGTLFLYCIYMRKTNNSALFPCLQMSWFDVALNIYVQCSSRALGWVGWLASRLLRFFALPNF